MQKTEALECKAIFVTSLKHSWKLEVQRTLLPFFVVDTAQAERLEKHIKVRLEADIKSLQVRKLSPRTF